MTDHPRRVLKVTGSDRISFLQGLVTNDVNKLSDGAVYTALLTPQGKYIADFFLIPQGDAILIDVAAPLAASLMQRLSLYKLRANVSLEETEIVVTRGLGPLPAGAFADPRHADLGWRSYDGAPDQDVDWAALRVAHQIPESLIELTPDSFILEMNFEALNGVDFRKGCYVGQEVTARMKHKTELRKGLAQVQVSGSAPVGTPIESDGKPAGTLYSQADGLGLAYLRFDRATSEMVAADARLKRS